jgi:hypothetical protein
VEIIISVIVTGKTDAAKTASRNRIPFEESGRESDNSLFVTAPCQRRWGLRAQAAHFRLQVVLGCFFPDK